MLFLSVLEHCMKSSYTYDIVLVRANFINKRSALEVKVLKRPSQRIVLVADPARAATAAKEKYIIEEDNAEQQIISEKDSIYKNKY